MYRMYFENPTIETIMNGNKNLVLQPFIGMYPIEHLEENHVKILYAPTKPPEKRNRYSIIGLYMLYYDKRKVKLGTSSIFNIIARMYSQAPLLGIIQAIYINESDIPLNSDLDQFICKNSQLKDTPLKNTIRCKKPKMINILNAWLQLNKSNIKYYIEMGKLLSRYIDDLVYNNSFFKRISPLNKYWFTPLSNDEVYKLIKETIRRAKTKGICKILRSKCRKNPCNAILTTLPNGLCIIKLNSIGEYIITCDTLEYNTLLYFRS